MVTVTEAYRRHTVGYVGIQFLQPPEVIGELHMLQFHGQVEATPPLISMLLRLLMVVCVPSSSGPLVLTM